MWSEIKPGRQQDIEVDGYRAAAYEFGAGDEAALHHPGAAKRLNLENTVADMPHPIRELHRPRAAPGQEAVAMPPRHEAMGTLGHPARQRNSGRG
ncbi:hypothetical protein [Acerihabitans arboris]|uniref:Uncharacterized protein n=1 Tax=Acerihabitans arboris TaxID=2691583 RepID=A0A845SJQ0_9GAMM|nr:hypothetical protein [Acerihabitans arboris]NDL65453.1 hypothetical protein [Acerihabitans arboris]